MCGAVINCRASKAGPPASLLSTAHALDALSRRNKRNRPFKGFAKLWRQACIEAGLLRRVPSIAEETMGLLGRDHLDEIVRRDREQHTRLELIPEIPSFSEELVDRPLGMGHKRCDLA